MEYRHLTVLQAGCRGFESLTAHQEPILRNAQIPGKHWRFRTFTSKGVLWKPNPAGGYYGGYFVFDRGVLFCTGIFWG